MKSYITITSRKFAELPKEGQDEAIKTYALFKNSEDCRPDEWKRIVDYYYDCYIANCPDGWFCWWE